MLDLAKYRSCVAETSVGKRLPFALYVFRIDGLALWVDNLDPPILAPFLEGAFLELIGRGDDSEKGGGGGAGEARRIEGREGSGKNPPNQFKPVEEDAR